MTVYLEIPLVIEFFFVHNSLRIRRKWEYAVLKIHILSVSFVSCKHLFNAYRGATICSEICSESCRNPFKESPPKACTAFAKGGRTASSHTSLRTGCSVRPKRPAQKPSPLLAYD